MEYEKLIKAFQIIKDTPKQTLHEIWHHKDVNGYYECYRNGKIYKRTTKTGFCWGCGNKVTEKIEPDYISKRYDAMRWRGKL